MPWTESIRLSSLSSLLLSCLVFKQHNATDPISRECFPFTFLCFYRRRYSTLPRCCCWCLPIVHKQYTSTRVPAADNKQPTKRLSSPTFLEILLFQMPSQPKKWKVQDLRWWSSTEMLSSHQHKTLALARIVALLLPKWDNNYHLQSKTPNGLQIILRCGLQIGPVSGHCHLTTLLLLPGGTNLEWLEEEGIWIWILSSIEPLVSSSTCSWRCCCIPNSLNFRPPVLRAAQHTTTHKCPV